MKAETTIDWTIGGDIAHKCELGTLLGFRRRKTSYRDKVLHILQDKTSFPHDCNPYLWDR